jgi:hypothetical protein
MDNLQLPLSVKVVNAIWEVGLNNVENYIEPVAILFDTNEVSVIPKPHLTDISWSEKGRPTEVVLEFDIELIDDLKWGGVEDAKKLLACLFDE